MDIPLMGRWSSLAMIPVSGHIKAEQPVNSLRIYLWS